RARKSRQTHDRAWRSYADHSGIPPGDPGPCDQPAVRPIDARRLAQGHLASRLADGRARRDSQSPGPDRLESRPRRQGAQDQLPGAALQDETPRPPPGTRAPPHHPTAHEHPRGRIPGVTPRLLSTLLPAVLALSATTALAQTANRPGPTAAVQPPNGTNGASPSNGAAPDAYRIGPEDMLQITVWKNEAMSRIVPVRPDGIITLPLLHDVQAAGRTPMELRDDLAKKLVEFMPAPEVSVIVTDVRSFKVSVIGEVAKPARYELKSWTTVLDVLAL